MNKLEKLKLKFYLDKEGNPNINMYGDFNRGLSPEEIDDYLRVRFNTLYIKRIRKYFYEIAGANGVGVYICPKCKDKKILMFRHDVLRYTSQLYKKKRRKTAS